MARSGTRARSAGTGRFITKAHAARSPRTTLVESAGARSSGGTYRSARTGQFVTTKHGKASPNTTIKDA